MDGCPETLYELMLDMWSREAEDRPDFMTVVIELQEILAAEGDTGVLLCQLYLLLYLTCV